MDNQFSCLTNLLYKKKKLWEDLHLKGESIRKLILNYKEETPERQIEKDLLVFHRESEEMIKQLAEMDKIIFPLYHLWLKEKSRLADKYNKEIEEIINAVIFFNKELLVINEQVVTFIQKEKNHVGEKLLSLIKGKQALAGYKSIQGKTPRLNYQG